MHKNDLRMNTERLISFNRARARTAVAWAKARGTSKAMIIVGLEVELRVVLGLRLRWRVGLELWVRLRVGLWIGLRVGLK